MILLLDVYNMVYAGYYALTGQLPGAPPHVVALYGFFRQLLGRVENNLSYRYVFLCFDHGECEWRMKLLPQYKQQRHQYKSDEERTKKEAIQSGVMKAVETLWEMRHTMPWFSVRAENTEADDLIGALRYTYPQAAVQIVSGDRDFRQLLMEPYTSIYSPVRSIEINPINWNDHGAIKAKTRGKDEKIVVPIVNYLTFRALSGDVSDNIPGVAGCGDITAARICSTEEIVNAEDLMHGGVVNLLKARGLKTAKATAAKLNTKQASADFNRNLALMSLRFGSDQIADVGSLVHRWSKPWDQVRGEFWAQLEEWKFKSIQTKFRAFDFMAERIANL